MLPVEKKSIRKEMTLDVMSLLQSSPINIRMSEKDYNALKEFNTELKRLIMEHPVEIKTAKQEGPL